MNTHPLRYAGFWPRLASLLLDFIVMLPLLALVAWGQSAFRLFNLYYFIPSLLFSFFYSIYLVKRFGGTPGKLIVGIRIRKLDGEPIGYREAVLRALPDFILGTLLLVATIISLSRLTDTEYHSLSWTSRNLRLIALAPSWYKPLNWIQNAWIWSEFIVLLTNQKRRALHDFIAGTVVVHNPKPAATTPQPPATLPVASTN